ncbi:hypothetical protein DBIPINDM_001573 [Mesorhizobium sp. AR02]|uniref:hypothetical protein n=1 Tax=Mesorhizobium sp. AR02 TaxID=2865837 RepID=UPI00215FB7F9|nr:hypothetical protein [Mesorhizobium sp. AR02]UVK55083.1 hypothetical protein DBIPINDM_001573 [Mesorhizobium sp. AR02]
MDEPNWDDVEAQLNAPMPARPTGPPKRDPWDDYAIEQVSRHMMYEELHLEDQCDGFVAYAVIAAAWAIGIVVYAIYRTEAPSAGTAALGAGCVLAVVILTALRVHCGFLLRRLRRQKKRLDSLGLRYL